MQTFLPYPDFMESAHCLDSKRLGKQRVEVLQILKALNGDITNRRWRNHPATKMWAPYQGYLVLYGQTICLEWINLGYSDTCFNKIGKFAGSNDGDRPPWLGDQRLHDSHKSNLLRKDPEYYGRYGWGVPNDLEYFWPV